jgi:hypothetical protein
MPALAMHRLERHASVVAPLRSADRSLATLTCRRLEALRVVERGDAVLAAALARYDQRGTAEALPERRTARLARSGIAELERTPARAGGSFAPPAARPASREQQRAADRRAKGDDRRGRRRKPATAAVGAATRRRRTTKPIPPQVQGLEWLVGSAPGGREAALSTLDLSPPAGVSDDPGAMAATANGSRLPLVPRHGGDGAPPMRTAVDGDGSRAPFAPARPERSVIATPASDAPVDAPATRPAGTGPGAGQLSALVRAWDGPAPVDEPDSRSALPAIAPDPAESPGPHDEPSGSGPPAARARDGAGVAAPTARDELLDLGDQLGRLLVSELRRYGIEVEE